MGVMLIGLVLFFGAHVFVTLRGPRAAMGKLFWREV